ncbi:hypothetical protein FLK61_27235 [Paenalkalicoccus suaedae]|uniref:Uncharacterized protein n=1 Tax=Paenalkalicoccus suaedae TaxID=2592382 RepID=A0A859FBX0_9BACI|nr:hypothetical protein [Paenalkalicoccus suaedae]QKS70450.1 hypothetical protein FLK61_27235 [Paenalkalicoccus suaedae]
MSFLTRFLLLTVAVLVAITGVIALLVQTTSAIMGAEVIIESWTALLAFSAAVVLWIIPVQLIDWLKLVRVQRRPLRIMYPYLITLIHVTAFALYIVTMTNVMSDVFFSNVGLGVFTLAIIMLARYAYVQLARSVRKYKEPRVQVVEE